MYISCILQEDMPHSGDDDTEFISVKKEKTKKINKSVSTTPLINSIFIYLEH